MISTHLKTLPPNPWLQPRLPSSHPGSSLRHYEAITFCLCNVTAVRVAQRLPKLGPGCVADWMDAPGGSQARWVASRRVKCGGIRMQASASQYVARALANGASHAGEGCGIMQGPLGEACALNPRCTPRTTGQYTRRRSPPAPHRPGAPSPLLPSQAAPPPHNRLGRPLVGTGTHAVSHTH